MIGSPAPAPGKSSYSLWIAIPILTTLTQACLKMLASEMSAVDFGWPWLLEAIQTRWALGILASETLAFTLWLRVLSHTSISKAIPITAIAYCLILLTSWTVFRESVMLLQIVGSVLILSGVWLISTTTQPTEALL